ncbi:MAG: response regulator [Planctomycetota bacterium]
MSGNYILIVDDEPHIRAVLARAFERAGYEVDVAHEGREALEAIGSAHPIAVVTDFQMPLLDGLSLARALHEDETTRDIPVVLLTARGHLVTEESRANTSIKRVMAKPFGARELIEVVRGLIEDLPADRGAA